MNKPECDYIKGIPPAVAIEQKVNTSNPRSTVGTSTEIYDYIKLLYARAGQTFSPVSGKEVKRDQVDDICRFILQGNSGKNVVILAKPQKLHQQQNLSLLLSQGFTRIKYGNEFLRIDDVVTNKQEFKEQEKLYLVIDRISVNDERDTMSRVSESVETALYEGNGECFIELDGKIHSFSNRFEADGMTFQVPSVNMFSFNSPIGACPTCEGYGRILGIDEDLVVPNKTLSVYEDVVMCWRGEVMSEWKHQVVKMHIMSIFRYIPPIMN